MPARYVACLLAQAMYAAEAGDEELEAALGPSVDLLVWILKYEGAEDSSGMRPSSFLLASDGCLGLWSQGKSDRRLSRFSACIRRRLRASTVGPTSGLPLPTWPARPEHLPSLGTLG